MPGKGKGKARGKSRGKSKGKRSESLQWKVKYRVSARYLRETGQTLTEARAAMLRHFDRTGEQLPGTHIVVSWRNRNNSNPLHANWKDSDGPRQSLGGAFNTLHGSMDRAMETAASDLTIKTPVTAKGPSTETRSQAMRKYHASLQTIAAKHPSWRHEKVRAEYRKQRGKRK